MIEKKRCPNCGAYVNSSDKTCYVCGEVLPEEPEELEVAVEPAEKARSPKVVFEPEKDDDFVMPVDYDEASGIPLEERRPYSDDEIVTAQSASEKRFIEANNKRNRKVMLVCGICIGVVVIAAAVLSVLHFTGVFNNTPKPGDKITLYFDKPASNLTLTDSNGKAYKWTADVNVLYTVNNKEEEIACTPCVDYKNLWKCKIPVEAIQVYFRQAAGKDIHTQVLQTVENDNVYYVISTNMNYNDDLPVESCKLSDFANNGVNGTEPTTAATSTAAPTTTAPESTAAPTETETETEPETEPVTEPDPDPDLDPEDYYTVSIPDSWASGTTAVDEGKCITYYETYNYQNSQLGRLLSIYVLDANDPEIEELHSSNTVTSSDGKKKIIAVTPSDFQCDDSDEKAIKKYTALEQLTSQVVSSLAAR